MVARFKVVRPLSAKNKELKQVLSLKIEEHVKKKGLTDAQINQAFNKTRKDVIGAAMAYYGGFVKMLDIVLTNPQMKGYRTGGVMQRNVTLDTPNTLGLPAQVKMQITGEGAWDALNPQYIAGKLPPPPQPGSGIPSKSYWRKTGDLAREFRASRPSAAELSSFGRYARTSVNRKPDSKRLAIMHLRIDFPIFRGDPQVDKILRGGFAAQFAKGKGLALPPHITGIPKKITDAYRNQPLNHLLLAEGGPFARPWIAKFAQQAGQAFFKAINSLAR